MNLTPDEFYSLPRWQAALRSNFGADGRPQGHGAVVSFIGEIDWSRDGRHIQIAVAKKEDGALLTIEHDQRGPWEYSSGCMSFLTLDDLVEHLVFVYSELSPSYIRACLAVEAP